MKKIILTALAVLMMFGLVGCSGDLHDGPATIVISFKDGGVLTLTDCGGPNVVVDGSPFSWNGGTSVKLEGYGPVYNISATADNFGNGDWVSSQSPFLGAYPEGFDASAKLAIAGTEAFVPYKKGGNATYSWNDRK